MLYMQFNLSYNGKSMAWESGDEGRAVNAAGEIVNAAARSRRPTVPNPQGPDNGNFYRAFPFVAGAVTLVGSGVLFMGFDHYFLNGFVQHNFLPKFEPFAEIGASGVLPGLGMYGLTKAVVNRR